MPNGQQPAEFLANVSRDMGFPNPGPIAVVPENVSLLFRRHRKDRWQSRLKFWRSRDVLGLFRPGDVVYIPYSKAALARLTGL